MRVLPVVDAENRVEGLISFFQLGEFFIPSPKESRDLRRVHTNIDSIIRSLNAVPIHVVEEGYIEELSVHVGAMDIQSFGEHHKKLNTPIDRSIIVVGDRSDIQKKSIELGVRLLIISGGLSVDPSIVEFAKANQVSLIISPHDSATTSWIVRTASQLEGLIESKIHCYQKDDRVSSIKKRIANLEDPLYMVVEGDKKLIGVFSKATSCAPLAKKLSSSITMKSVKPWTVPVRYKSLRSSITTNWAIFPVNNPSYSSIDPSVQPVQLLPTYSAVSKLT